MVRKILGKILICSIFLYGGSMSAEYTNAMTTEADAIALGEKVSSGTVSDAIVEPFAKIITLLEDTTHPLPLPKRAQFTKNIFLSMLKASEFIEFQTKCSSALTALANSIKVVTGNGAQYNLPYLLYLTQVTEAKDALLPTAKSEIVEEIINKLSAAKNGDKAHADQLLTEFYRLLEQSPTFKMYVPNR